VSGHITSNYDCDIVGGKALAAAKIKVRELVQCGELFEDYISSWRLVLHPLAFEKEVERSPNAMPRPP